MLINNYHKYFFIIESIHVSLLILFMIMDAIVLYLASNEEFVNNKYFLFHKKWGYLKIEFIKLVAALVIIYELTHGTMKSGTMLAIILAYCIFVSKFLIDYVSFKRKKEN